ncbi:MAG: hypothetical protein OEY00_03450 [Gammaproteobacteria bacterium]|nr:hypothetical protein [Gammaproteobacteria bacterium]
MAQTQLALDLPAREKPDKSAFDIRPRKLEAWIGNLPRANLGETARQVYKAIKETNHLSFNHTDRAHFLELMREPVYYITGAMKKYYVAVNFPLAEKNSKIASACREIFMTMATGYKIAIEDQLNSALLFPDSKLLSKHIHRALTMLGHVLMTSYRSYEPYPESIWADIHQLYRFAEKKKLTFVEIEDTYRRYTRKSSIRDQYLRLLLLHLASPYRLRQGEVGKVYNTLERWTRYIEIEKNLSPSHSGFFGVNIASDQPPRSLALTTEKCGDEYCRVLATEPLAVIIKDEIQNGTDMATTTLPGIEMQRDELSHDLLRRLLIAWGIVPKRVFPRSENREPVQITFGLSSSHKVISDGNASDPQKYQSRTRDRFINTAKYNATNVNDINDEKPDVWDLAYPGTRPVKEPEREVSFDSDTSAEFAEQSYNHIETWAILNESAGGYCLKAEDIPSSNIQVGELVGIQRTGDGHTWKWGIATIRWMRQDKQKGLFLGVEMLTPDAAAIGIRSAFSDEQDEFRRTLMLPELPAINQPKTLITGPVPFRVGNQLSMRIVGKEFPIVLTKQLQNTGFFAQFEFKMAETSNVHNINKPEAKKDDDIDNVWSLI